MAEQKKIGVDPETKALVGMIAAAESRSEAGQIRHWAKKDAKRLELRVPAMVRQIPKPAPTFPENQNLNKAQNGNVNKVDR